MYRNLEGVDCHYEGLPGCLRFRVVMAYRILVATEVEITARPHSRRDLPRWHSKDPKTDTYKDTLLMIPLVLIHGLSPDILEPATLSLEGANTPSMKSTGSAGE